MSRFPRTSREAFGDRAEPWQFEQDAEVIDWPLCVVLACLAAVVIGVIYG